MLKACSCAFSISFKGFIASELARYIVIIQIHIANNNDKMFF
jgi:hypothetical protein